MWWEMTTHTEQGDHLFINQPQKDYIEVFVYCEI